MTEADIIGNGNADRLAGKWDKSPLDHNIVLRYFRAVKLVKAIQSGLSAVITYLPPPGIRLLRFRFLEFLERRYVLRTVAQNLSKVSQMHPENMQEHYF